MTDAAYRKEKPRPQALQMRLAMRDPDDFATRYAPNVSAQGVFVRSRDPRPLGTRLSFELRLANGDVVLEGEGVVRWVQGQDARSDAVAGMGIEFETLTDESRALVERMEERRAAEGTELVDGANPERWAPLDEHPTVAPPVIEDEPPAPPPILAPLRGFVRPDPAEQTPVQYAPIATRTPARVLVGLHLDASTLHLSAGSSTVSIPAAVAVAENGELLYGEAALGAGHRAVRGLGSLLGLRPGTSAARAWERRHLSDIRAGDDGNAALRLGNHTLGASALCRELLRLGLEAFQDRFAQEPTRAVVLQPASTPESRRRALRDLALGCGLDVEATLPTSIGVFFAFERTAGRTLVVEAGEGAACVSLVRAGEKSVTLERARRAPDVVGADVELAVLNALFAAHEAETATLVPEDAVLFEQVREKVVEARRALTEGLDTRVFLPGAVQTGLSRSDFDQKLTRARLQALSSGYVDGLVEEVRRLMVQASIGPREIDRVLLAGDHATVPGLERRLTELFAQPLVVEPKAGLAATGASTFATERVADGEPTLTLTLDTALWLLPEDGGAKRLVDAGTTLPSERTYVAVAPDGRLELELGVIQGDSESSEERVGTLLVGPMPAPSPGERARATVRLTIHPSGDFAFSAQTLGGENVPTTLDRARFPELS